MTRFPFRWIALAAILSCKGGGGEADRSYCDALCDWAVECHATERTIDSAARHESCLAATSQVDASCADADAGTLDPASAALLQTCVQAVDDLAAAGECSAFVGTIDEIKLGAPPQDCISQGADAQATFDAARDATVETGDELCQRFTDTFCLRAEECVLGDFGGQIPQEATDQLGTPFEHCVNLLEPAFTGECKSQALYAEEQSLTDANLPRQAARECLRGFDGITCEQIFAGTVPQTCAGAFTTEEQAVGFASALYQLSDDFAQYAQ